MAAESGFLPPIGAENNGLLGRLWQNIWQWYAPGWRDEKSQIIIRGAGAADPVWTRIGATDFWCYLFPGHDGAALKEWHSFIHIDHMYRIGTPIYLHVHYIPLTASPSGNVKWLMSVAAAKGHQQQTFNFSAPLTMNVVQAVTTQYQHMIAEISDADAKSITDSLRIEPDSVIAVRVWRNPADSQDTYGAAGAGTGDVGVLFFDAHYQVSRMATKNRTPRDESGNLVGFYR